MNEDSMFRFREITQIDPEKLAIRKGDKVLYENNYYIVTECGMRWLRAEREGEPGSQYSLKKASVVKIFPELERPL